MPFQFPTKRSVTDAKLPDGEVAIGVGVTLLTTRRAAMLRNQRATPDVAFPERYMDRKCENVRPDGVAFDETGVRQ